MGGEELIWYKVGKSGKKVQNSRINKLDNKGRVSVPFTIRRELKYGEPLILTRGLDPCVAVYTEEQWRKLMRKLDHLKPTKIEHRKVIRRIVGDADRIELDEQGRIRIPSHLLEFAGIKGECRFVRMLDHFEIWNPETYEEHMKDLPASVDIDIEGM